MLGPSKLAVVVRELQNDKIKVNHINKVELFIAISSSYQMFNILKFGENNFESLEL